MLGVVLNARQPLLIHVPESMKQVGLVLHTMVNMYLVAARLIIIGAVMAQGKDSVLVWVKIAFNVIKKAERKLRFLFYRILSFNNGRPLLIARLRILRRWIFSVSKRSPIMANIIGTNMVEIKVETNIPPTMPVPIA